MSIEKSRSLFGIDQTKAGFLGALSDESIGKS
jgi:hypothetical protein